MSTENQPARVTSIEETSFDEARKAFQKIKVGSRILFREGGSYKGPEEGVVVALASCYIKVKQNGFLRDRSVWIHWLNLCGEITD